MTGKLGLQKEDVTKIKSIIEGLEADPRSEIFKEPVDYVGLGLTDYLDIVKHPMDLSTVSKKLKLSQYPTHNDVLNDLNLIWANCKSYNLQGSEIYLLAVAMEKICKKLWEKQFKERVGKKPEKNSKSGDSQVGSRSIVKKESDSDIKRKKSEPEPEPEEE